MFDDCDIASMPNQWFKSPWFKSANPVVKPETLLSHLFPSKQCHHSHYMMLRQWGYNFELSKLEY